MTCGFSRVTGKSSCSSAAKLGSGASVPLVSRKHRVLSAASRRSARPGRKHLQYMRLLRVKQPYWMLI